MIQDGIEDLNNRKIENLSTAIFNLLKTGFHRIDEFHKKFTVYSIGGSIYTLSARYYSGKISKRAQEAIDSGTIVRSRLCKEHPNPRHDTAHKIINTYENHVLLGSNEKVVFSSIKQHLIEGSLVHLVLSEENTDLVKFQKEGLSPEECYRNVGIELIEDLARQPKMRYLYNGKIYNTQPEIARDCGISRTTVQRRIKQGLITVEKLS